MLLARPNADSKFDFKAGFSDFCFILGVLYEDVQRDLCRPAISFLAWISRLSDFPKALSSTSDVRKRRRTSNGRVASRPAWSFSIKSNLVLQVPVSCDHRQMNPLRCNDERKRVLAHSDFLNWRVITTSEPRPERLCTVSFKAYERRAD
jgi:hypothetical protein